MKKLIGLLLGIFLFTSIAYASPYKLDPIMDLIKKQGKVIPLDSDTIVPFLEFHSADKNKTHTSYYISILFNRAVENVFLPNKLSFLKEEWVLENNTWTINRFTITDNDLDENTDIFQCEVLKETADTGAVLSLESVKCIGEDALIIKEILEKTAFKIQL